MNQQALLAKFHKELRQEVQSIGYIREETANIVRHVSAHQESGFIIASTLTDENARYIIQQELAYFKERQQNFEWKVYSYDQPAHLQDLLQEEGFTLEGEEALLVMALSKDHAIMQTAITHQVKEITDDKGIKEIAQLESQIWSEDKTALGARLCRDKQQYPNDLYLYGVYEDNQLVSAAWMYIEPNTSFVSLWGGSTLAAYRGKGYYTQLLAMRAQKAYEQGYRLLTVDASPMSRPILERHGFSCLANCYEYQSPR